MGYQVTFAPTEEKMNQYRPHNEKCSESMVDNYKYELISLCMKNKDSSTYQTIKQIKYLLECIYKMVERDEKESAYFRWKEDEDHQLWYCGWEFAQDTSLNKEDVINNTTEKLFILANLVETPDYFEAQENFNTKYQDVSEDVNGFIECVSDIVIHDIINELDEFRLKNEED